MLGGVSSTTVTLKEQLGPSTTVQLTVVEPTVKTDPEGGAQLTGPQPLAGANVTTLPQEVAPGKVGKNRSGQLSVQVPVATVVLVVTELFARFGSLDVPLTEALLVIVEPDTALTFTTRVIAADPPGGSPPSEQVTVPVAPTGGVLQLPGLVSDTNVVPTGIMSVKVAPRSASGPLLVTTIA